jgi:hypothetical protein
MAIKPSNSLEKSLLSVPVILCSAALGPLNPKKNSSTRRHDGDSNELGVKASTQPLWGPHASETTEPRKWLQWWLQ